MSDRVYIFKVLKHILIYLLVLLSGCADQSNSTNSSSEPNSIISATVAVTTFPEQVSADCREGIAKIYDECGNQQIILKDALKAAQKADKRVLISYGAEWCIWCHVFDRYVKGHSKKFDYQWQYYDGEDLDWTMFEMENKRAEQQAADLNKYFANNFVLAHIESYYAPNGEQVLISLGYDAEKIIGVPVILVLDSVGEIAAEMKSNKELIGLEVREDSGREFRGYDRQLLLAELKRMRLLAE